jgi:hypothetical protein
MMTPINNKNTRQAGIANYTGPARVVKERVAFFRMTIRIFDTSGRESLPLESFFRNLQLSPECLLRPGRGACYNRRAGPRSRAWAFVRSGALSTIVESPVGNMLLPVDSRQLSTGNTWYASGEYWGFRVVFSFPQHVEKMLNNDSRHYERPPVPVSKEL